MARIISWSFILLTMYNAILQPEPEPVRKDQKSCVCASFAISRSNMEATSKMLLLLFMVAFEVFAGKCFIILLCVTSNLCRHSTASNCVDYRSCREVRSSNKGEKWWFCMPMILSNILLCCWISIFDMVAKVVQSVVIFIYAGTEGLVHF